jgi:thiamine-monophosphate kinase
VKVSEIGEFGLIDRLARMVSAAEDKKAPAWRHLILGIGDDAAAWQGEATIQLATVDALVQDVHFRLNLTSWAELGWKAIAINLSDIAAMGGQPRYALVSLALPDETEVENVTSLYQGMLDLARRFEVAIVGGNISRAPLVVINITIFGNAKGRRQNLLTRSAAEVGDQVAVTGYLGAAVAGLEMLTRRLQFDAEATASLRKAFLQPYPRVAEGQALVKCGVKAAIDISDGLISDLNHICQSSQVGARIEVERVPIAPAVKANFGTRALELALSGGEDYELLFTARAGVIEPVRSAISCPVTVIGEIVADKASKITLVDKKGNPVSLPRMGWDHFARQ